jgi:hypothetical protein
VKKSPADDAENGCADTVTASAAGSLDISWPHRGQVISRFRAASLTSTWWPQRAHFHLIMKVLETNQQLTRWRGVGDIVKCPNSLAASGTLRLSNFTLTQMPCTANTGIVFWR